MNDMDKRIGGNLFSMLVGGLTVGIAIYLWRHDAESASAVGFVWAMAVIGRACIFVQEVE